MTPGPGIARTPLPKGFYASGVNCGVRRYRPDLGLILSDPEAVVAGVFTTNQCAAAPVRYCRDLLPAERIRAIITNSGQANAATGEQGDKDNREMAFEVAKELVCLPRQILTASTGVIGVPLEIEKILPAIPRLIDRATDSAENFALAILTTDLVPKTVTTVVELSGGSVRITGICKGSGMIHPNMATMLGYLLTDVSLTPRQAQAFLTETANVSFNMISVDGDTSTNDATFLMANGASGVEVSGPQDEATFLAALKEIAIVLAQSIARDGEGASKLVEINVLGAPDEAMAKRAARGVTVSPLVKTAIHGEDPNWGRMIARLGAEQVPYEVLMKASMSLQGFLLYDAGRPQVIDRDAVRAMMKKDKIVVDIDLKSGPYKATAWGCDLSKKYVDINTEYST